VLGVVLGREELAHSAGPPLGPAGADGAAQDKALELVAPGGLGGLRGARGVDGAQLRPVPRARGEDGGVAARQSPLDVAAEVPDDRLGSGAAQARGLAVRPHEPPHGVSPV
jgi:hypothetical protein